MSNLNQTKKIKHAFIFMAILFCLCGFLIMVFPYNSLTAIGIIIGVTALMAGIIQAVRALMSELRGGDFVASIISSVFTIICSIVIMIFSKNIMHILPMIIGLFIIIDGAFKIDTSICAKNYRVKSWIILFLLAGLTIISGFLCVRIKVSATNIGLISSLVGLALFMCGLQNIFSPLYMNKITARAREEIKKRAEKILEDEMMEEMFDEAEGKTEDTVLTDIAQPDEDTDTSDSEFSAIDIYVNTDEADDDFKENE